MRWYVYVHHSIYVDGEWSLFGTFSLFNWRLLTECFSDKSPSSMQTSAECTNMLLTKEMFC